MIVFARLIVTLSSRLTNLAKCQFSTLQILGAEKALFRALKTKGNTPKYGLIFHSSFIGRASAKNKGRMARYLANKCSIASRIDCFSESSTTTFGDNLHVQVEECLDFYDKGVAPRKNIDVMKAAMKSVANQGAKMDVDKSDKKSKKKKSKDSEEAKTDDKENTVANVDIAETKSKKKKKKRVIEEELEPATNGKENGTKKKKKKSKDVEMEDVFVVTKSKKKKKSAK
uniref:Nucleolar protein 56 n=1 Tax=Tanacetum cinerariifolium TaxID=118510 RepID=A0A6L2JU98_TANCI|nr:hypothetical protein [Tanacetum cinerariifolium]